MKHLLQKSLLTKNSNSTSLRVKFGFTLIEIMVVVSIIAVLAAVALSSISDAREGALEANAKQEIDGMVLGVLQLILDTNRGPNGCPYDGIASPSVMVNNSTAGLLTVPAIDTSDTDGDGCWWPATAVAKWNGPYFTETEDPWGNPYWYDADYIPYQNCVSETTLPATSAIVSRGADDSWYTCDDVYKSIQ